uniref:Reverse transcriptase n=1 Tax=Cannabis sativa TaxID=3483 RepID=A0A803NN45_CANSA
MNNTLVRDGAIEMELLELFEDITLEEVVVNKACVGKIVGCKDMPASVVKKILTGVWRRLGPWKMKKCEEGVLGFFFHNEEDCAFVLQKRPWLVNGIGELAETDGSSKAEVVRRGYLRMWVDVWVAHPIPAGFFLKSDGKPESWVQFKYEKLPMLCFNCGVLKWELEEIPEWELQGRSRRGVWNRKSVKASPGGEVPSEKGKQSGGDTAEPLRQSKTMKEKDNALHSGAKDDLIPDLGPTLAQCIDIPHEWVCLSQNPHSFPEACPISWPNHDSEAQKEWEKEVPWMIMDGSNRKSEEILNNCIEVTITFERDFEEARRRPNACPTVPMRCLSWNCRELRRPAAERTLRGLVRESNADLIFLSETKVDEISMIQVVVRLGFENHSCIPAKGLAGGFCVAWKSGRGCSISQIFEAGFCIRIMSLGCSEPWFLFCMYGTPYPALKNEYWDWLTNTVKGCNANWAVMGDLNVIMNAEEKEGGKQFHDKEGELLRDFLFDTGGIDLGCEVKFPILGSDHAPICLQTLGDNLKLRYPFRFSKSDFALDCERVVKGVESSESPLVRKLARTKWELKKWNQEVFGFCDRKLVSLRHQLGEIQRDIITQENVQREAEVQLEILEMEGRMDRIWRQKSRKLIRFGDANSKFFHSSTIINRRLILSTMLKFPGACTIGVEFEPLFVEKVTEEDNDFMGRLPEVEEIREVVFKLHPLKAPGPDGFPGNSEKNRYCALKSWNDLCQPKACGGLGFRRLADMNVALLAKLFWMVLKEEDKLWASKSGKFSVKSAYWLSQRHRFKEPSKMWSSLWRTKVHPRLQLLCWKIFSDSLPTKGRIGLCRGDQLMCSFCHSSEETTLHLFFKCRGWESMVSSGQCPGFVVEMANEVIHKGRTCNVEEIYGDCMRRYSEFQSTHFSPNVDVMGDLGGEKPHQNVNLVGCRFRVDASVVEEAAGFAAVFISEDQPSVVEAGLPILKSSFAVSNGPVYSVLEGELHGIKLALLMAKESGLESVIIETDSKAAAVAFESGHMPFCWDIYPLFCECLRLCKNFHSCVVSFIPREQNLLADKRANGLGVFYGL